jgi:hypothetical protein
MLKIRPCFATKFLETTVFEILQYTFVGTIIRGTLKAPKYQLLTPISTKLQMPDGCD